MEQKPFVKGMYAYKPREKAPDWIKANLIINTKEFIEYLSQQEERITIDILETKDGSKWYPSLNTFKKPEQANTSFQPNHTTPIPPYKEKAEQVDLKEIPF
jgi:hypothetical protein